ncbi:DUF2158 domain-containing protein [Aureispira anguillae]|uniref:DUF2158 domain-containing protein n=1 Tax=Aureispira anguillae TaxID=2864201 RepID=A0A915YB10_9BACT|nr:DUF2158 domain-containing protein [Aureispira anguillae]BDS09770.1 DUF2158 domain-containing protein [Aureispira anguillae]
MPAVGDVVRLKSGGPDMIIIYVFQDGEGSRDKLGAIKGFGPGDVTCEWQQQINEDNFKNKKESFKAATLVYTDGTPLPVED